MTFLAGAVRRGAHGIIVAAAVLLLLPTTVRAQEPAPAESTEPASSDPATWSDDRLAAQLVAACVPISDVGRAVALAERGIGGVVLLGSDAPPDLAQKLAQLRAASPGAVPPLIAADEEGGTVQRLREVIGPLPSAATMGNWEPDRIRATAQRHGEAMRELGVLLALSPVADLAVTGAYIDRLGRAFSDDPEEVATAVNAWGEGMAASGVATVLKHWPGHGHAPDSHVTGAVIPAFEELQHADLVPFDAALEHGAPAVMVGHLISDGLTEPGTPASISPRALAELRRRAGDDVVIVTDSLTMAAVTTAIGISSEEAAVRALSAGADWALTCAADAGPTIDAVAEAITAGRLSRADVVPSARRILALKARVGAVSRDHACREPLVGPDPLPAGDATEFPDPVRVAGPSRYETAVAVSRTVWPDGAETVYVATGAAFPDALAATPLAASDEAPVLLVPPNGIPSAVDAELRRLQPERIVVVGGPAAVPESVAGALTTVAPVERAAGPDRAATAAALVERLAPEGADTVWLAAAESFPDALAAGPVAARDGAPLLLTGHQRLPQATVDALRELRPSTVVAVGGQAVVCTGVLEEVAGLTGATVERIAGATRYETAALLTHDATTAWVATGAAFADALAAGPAAAATDGALVLVPSHGDAGDAARRALSVVGPDQIVVTGGEAAVDPAVLDSLGATAAEADRTQPTSADPRPEPATSP